MKIRTKVTVHHNGAPHRPGTVLTVADTTGRALVGRGFAETFDGYAPADPSPEPADNDPAPDDVGRDLEALSRQELFDLARDLNLSLSATTSNADLIAAIKEAQAGEETADAGSNPSLA